MKKIVILILGIALAFPVFSQEKIQEEKSSPDDSQMKTLFGNHGPKRNIPIGYFFEFNAGYTQFGSEHVFLPGASFGMVLDHHWNIGLSGSFIGNPGNLYYPDIYHTYSGSAMLGAYLYGGYAGGLFEYTLLPKSVVHVSFPLIIGGGYFTYLDEQYTYSNDGNYHNSWDGTSIDYTVCFIIEPGVKAEFNILKMLRLGIGVSYRYSPNFELVNTSSGLINQFTGRVSLRFGKF
jgi:hypothetical protein